MLKVSRILTADTEYSQMTSPRQRPQEPLEADEGGPGPLTAQQIESGGLEDLLASHSFTNGLMAWAMQHYTDVSEGRGSSREVFKLDEDHALKIAKDKRGRAQNQVESHLAKHFHDLPITQVHYVAPSGVYLVVDYAHALNLDDFRAKFGVTFYKFMEMCKILTPGYLGNQHPLVQKQYQKQYQKEKWKTLPEACKKLFLSLIRHNILLEDVGAAYQWGEVKDNPVLVDYGYNKQVKQEYYTY